jgi:hypothetical protein
LEKILETYPALPDCLVDVTVAFGLPVTTIGLSASDWNPLLPGFGAIDILDSHTWPTSYLDAG